MTLTVGNYSIERRTIRHCDVCAQQEVDGIEINTAWEGSDLLVCIDCFMRALKLPTDETDLRVLVADLEHELTRCRFPNPELLERLKRAAGT